MKLIMTNLIFKDDWNSNIMESELLTEFLKYINNSDSVILNDININNNNKYKLNDCHNNVNKFRYKYGFDKYGKILGYYLLSNKLNNKILAIQHSVIINTITEKIFDITPSLYKNKIFIYGYKMQEYKHIIFSLNNIETEKTLISNIDGYIL